MNQPSPLQRLWEGWKRVARKIGEFQARVIMMLFYFVILAPFAILIRWANDPLALKPNTPKGWVAREDRENNATQQF